MNSGTKKEIRKPYLRGKKVCIDFENGEEHSPEE